MSLIAKMIFSLTGPLTIAEFEDKCRRPRDVQETLLRHIVEANQDTAFGRRYHFSKIKTFRDFQARVPVSTYEDLKPYIEAAMQGETGQLTAEKPVLFAMTSGTTGESKYIPVTPESRKAKADLMKVWLSALYTDHPEIFSGRILSVVSPEEECCAPDGTPCGSESGHAYRNIPLPVQMAYALPYEVFEIEDYESRYYAMLRVTAAQQISLIVTVNPSTVLLLCERLERHSRSIIQDVRHGGIAKHVSIPEAIAEKLGAHLLPDPERALELEQAAAQNQGKLLPKLIWPKLAAIACWQGGSAGLYLQKLKPYFPDDIPFRDLGYLATEHRGSVPLFDDVDAGVLAIATNVYEFFPADGELAPRVTELLTVDRVERDKRYGVCVTTLGGLYRYNMNDIVEVVDYYEKTPVIRFVQKGQGVVSFTGEKLSEAQVIAAVEDAFRPLSGHYTFIAAVGEMRGNKPQYGFLVEFDAVPERSRLEAIVKALDDCLCSQNAEYAVKRKSLRLDPATVRVVRRGELDRYRKREVAAGRTDSQFKILQLTSDAAFAKEFEVIDEVGLA